MKWLPPWILLLPVYAVLCRGDFQPISGALLDYWLDPSPGCIPTVSDVDAGQLPADISELRIVCLEVAEDSLDVFLLGLVPETDIPLLLASGGYRGLYNLTKMVASYHPEEDAIHVAFQMPYSATFLFGDYRWNRESQALELLRYSFGDPSRDSMDRVDSLLAEGGIAEAIDELDQMLYPSYDSEEMIARLLRAIDRTALEAYATGEGDPHAAVELYRCMDDFFYAHWEDWVTAFSDSTDYMECRVSGYMGLGEYAMILNNFGFYLEQAGEPEEALIVLRKVLQLDPSRMVAHLNIADVLWGLDRSIEAVENYTVYRDMMTERDLAEQLPERVLERVGGLAADEAGAAPRILRQLELPLETHLWVPVHLDGCEVTEDDGLRLRLSRRADPSTYEHGIRDLWTILIDPDGAAASLESLSSSSGILLTTGTLLAEMPESLFLIECTEGGDTLWTYPLASDEYCHSAFVTAEDGGDLLVSIHPDCFSDLSSVERVSVSGRSVFGQVLSTFTLLGLPPRDGETSPMVLSQALTSADDVLLTGYVRECMTTPAAWFVCLLDGATGELLSKAAGFGLGESEISDAIELPGGRILAAGSTWEWDENHITYGTPQPFLVMLDPCGRVLDSLILDESTGGFHSLIAHPAGGDRFLLAHSEGDPERLTILEMNLPMDQDSWSASWQGRSGGTSSKSLSRPRKTCRPSSSGGTVKDREE